MPHLKGLKLAHPVSSVNFEINLLVGADYHGEIVQDNVNRGEGVPQRCIHDWVTCCLALQKSKVIHKDVAKILHLSALVEEKFDLQRFWSLELMGISPQVDPPEKNVMTSTRLPRLSRIMIEMWDFHGKRTTWYHTQNCL